MLYKFPTFVEDTIICVIRTNKIRTLAPHQRPILMQKKERKK